MSLETLNELEDQYTDFINKLPGVLNSKIVINEGQIKEIHVLTDISRSPKQVVRDIQSLFMAQFRLQFDHRVVSVAQIECGKPQPQQNCARFSIEGITLAKRREGTDLEVCLSLDGEEFTGKRAGLKESHDVHRAIALSTLEAVSGAEGFCRSFSLLEIKFTEMAGERVCVVCITVSEPCNLNCRLVGTAFSKEDDAMAIVKATLDSLNRKICQP